jgi:hypothetical protein
MSASDRSVRRCGLQDRTRTRSLIFFGASLLAAGLNPENISADLVRTQRCRNSNPTCGELPLLQHVPRDDDDTGGVAFLGRDSATSFMPSEVA